MHDPDLKDFLVLLIKEEVRGQIQDVNVRWRTLTNLFRDRWWVYIWPKNEFRRDKKLEKLSNIFGIIPRFL